VLAAGVERDFRTLPNNPAVNIRGQGNVGVEVVALAAVRDSDFAERVRELVG